MNRTLTIMAVALAMLTSLSAGCAGFIDGVTRDTAPSSVAETTPTEEPARRMSPEDSADPLSEASDALVNATLELSRLAGGSGLLDDTTWRTAMDFWFREVESWLRRADGNMYEHLDRGNSWTRRNRLTGILDLEQMVVSLREAHLRLENAFRGFSVQTGIAADSIPVVRQALERVRRAIDIAETAVDSLAVRLGVR